MREAMDALEVRRGTGDLLPELECFTQVREIRELPCGRPLVRPQLTAPAGDFFRELADERTTVHIDSKPGTENHAVDIQRPIAEVQSQPTADGLDALRLAAQV